MFNTLYKFWRNLNVLSLNFIFFLRRPSYFWIKMLEITKNIASEELFLK